MYSFKCMQQSETDFSRVAAGADERVAGVSRVIVITGPTATGKSALAVRLSKMIGGEIVSADSMQIYKYMDIGTAKPTPEELKEVSHHLVNVAHPSEEYSVKRYVDDAVRCIDGIFRRGNTPIITGGTGLYIDSLLSGRDFSARNKDGLRKELEAEYDLKGGQFMLELLSTLDPQSAQTLHANDKKRIVRAIEVYKSTGKTISQHNLETQQYLPRYDAVKIALTYSDRSKLYEKINIRVEQMIEAGLEQEVRGLIKMNIPKNSTAMQAIGYKQMLGAIDGEISMSEAIEQIKQESRRYAKRQLTWLRRDKTVQWLAW